MLELSLGDLRLIRSALFALWLEASSSPEDEELRARVEAEIERREGVER